jgi:transcriptional regulator with XRE-family HTH domain
MGSIFKNKKGNGEMKEYLKSKRELAGVTQKDLSKNLGYTSPQFISNWERGISYPPVDCLKKISNFLKADIVEFKGVYVEHRCVEFKRKLEIEISKIK